MANFYGPILGEGHAIDQPPHFDDKNYIPWKNRMIVFLQSQNFKMWLIVCGHLSLPSNLMEEWTENDHDIFQLDGLAKHFLIQSLCEDELLLVSNCETAKGMNLKLFMIKNFKRKDPKFVC